MVYCSPEDDDHNRKRWKDQEETEYFFSIFIIVNPLETVKPDHGFLVIVHKMTDPDLCKEQNVK